MSLFTTLQLANNALRAQQIGIQVAGQNIANANTPGYAREEVLFSPAPAQRIGKLVLGLGVSVDGIIQRTDRFLDERLRNATSDRVSAEVQQQAYSQLETILGELSATDLSTSLNSFFSAVSEVLNQPESVSIRNLAALKGKTLAEDIRRLARRVTTVRDDLNTQIEARADDINRLTEEVRKLNVQIAATEGGDATVSDAVGLRDQRGLALEELAQLLDIRVFEDTSGAVNVFVGGDYLVFEGMRREVEIETIAEDGLPTSTIRLVDTGAALEVGGGVIAGLNAARDEILGGFLDQLDEFSRTLAFEFNQAYSSGQGLTGYQQTVSEFSVSDADAPLDAAGLSYTPRNGSFQILVRSKQTGLTQTTDLRIDLDGLGDNDTTFAQLVAALDAIDGLTASVSPAGKLVLASESSQQEFAFAGDTSGVLAALGINTFFTGTSAQNLGVNATVLADPGKFAASRGGIAHDTAIGEQLAGFLDAPLASRQGASLADLYDQIANGTTQGAAVAQAVTEGLQVFEDALRGQQLAISGVSVDEELVSLISLQRAFQATARLVSVANELLETLVNL